MAVKIRLKMMGSKKKPFYRVVAADVRSPRDGRFIEALGYYNPMSDPPEIKLDEDKVYKWLDAGAEPTANAGQILKKAGLLERWQLLKSGAKIHELDAVIEARRQKQPQPKPKSEKKPSKKRAAAEAAKAEEEKKTGVEAADEETATGADEAGEEAKVEADKGEPEENADVQSGDDSGEDKEKSE